MAHVLGCLQFVLPSRDGHGHLLILGPVLLAIQGLCAGEFTGVYVGFWVPFYWLFKVCVQGNSLGSMWGSGSRFTGYSRFVCGSFWGICGFLGLIFIRYSRFVCVCGFSGVYLGFWIPFYWLFKVCMEGDSLGPLWVCLGRLCRVPGPIFIGYSRFVCVWGFSGILGLFGVCLGRMCLVMGGIWNS